MRRARRNPPIRSALLAAVALLTCACATTMEPLPAVTAVPSDRHPGKFVWFDLLTDNAAAAKAFYGDMFGWRFEAWPGLDRYTLIKAGDETIGGILTLKPHSGEKISQWIGYVSVADVDQAAGAFEAKGGKIWKGPLDIPGRGRAALVADPQGAFVALLHSEKGDPPDGREPALNHWLWIDYVANDPERAKTFYGDLFGYSAEVADRVGEREYWLFKQSDHRRGGMFKNPWPNVRPHWLPYVRVTDPAALVEKAKRLGGTVVVEPRPELRQGSVALVLDPTGAGVVLQRWPFAAPGDRS